MKNTYRILLLLSLFLIVIPSRGEDKEIVKGRVLSSFNKPIEGAVVSITNEDGITTGKDGEFSFEVNSKNKSVISVWAAGFYPTSELVNLNKEVIIKMIPQDRYKYSESAVLPLRIEENYQIESAAVNITKKDFNLGTIKIDKALAGQVAGMKIVAMSGMPGEGSYFNLRGIRSFIGNNSPLIVINGVPYMPNYNESLLINGFSKDILGSYNIQDIQNITVLKGADAAIYGSLGSNGVILIETDGAASNDLNTKISFYGQYGFNWNDKRIPLLKGTPYKSYISDMGMTYFNNMESMFNEFPFLNNVNSKYSYLYDNKTDWQDEIYKNSFVTDNLFRVEGGDAIAKYDLSLGYMQNNGILDNTRMERYHTQLNTNVLVSKKLELFATVGLANLNGEYQEQGMIQQTNPVLSAYARSPLLSPYKKDSDGNLLSEYSSYYFGNSTNMDLAVSNPLAIINTIDARSRQYDINVRAGLTYKPLTELSFTTVYGLYYNYNNEHLFVPGITDKSILPINDRFGEARNTVKEGISTTFNSFYNLNGRYTKTFNERHYLDAMIGMQIVMNKYEYDVGHGRNTANDFYQTLGTTQSIGRSFSGYEEKWNWMNYYMHVGYTYDEKITASINMSVDGSSATGTYANRFYLYPSLGLTLLGKGWLPIDGSTFINRLNLRGEYSHTGNTNFSSKYGRFYYTTLPYQSISGIVRANISNTKLKPEMTNQINIGLDVTMWNNRISFSADYYNNKTKDVIFNMPISTLYGTSNYYMNAAQINNNGVELSLNTIILQTHDFEWNLGGNIAWNKGTINSLGSIDQLIQSYSDGAQLISKVYESPYNFYGYNTLGVFATQEEAEAANLINNKGLKYEAGDMHYEDINKDGRIDDKDRVSLGNASPTYFGGFFSRIKYRSFTVSAEFTYSKGNMAYNAVRRELESGSSFDNQSSIMANRWGVEGQITDIPKIAWNDPIGNSDFSSRWIEDASYIRMKNITVSYSFDKKVLNFFRSGTIYVTGENLLTGTKYLGLDPEFSYSHDSAIQGFDYAKLMQPKRVKLGVNLKF